MVVNTINSKKEFDELVASGKLFAVDFSATWCGPCKVISPIYEQLSEAITGIEYYKVDVDEQPEVAEEVGIRAMPTFIIFKEGQKIDDLTGADPRKLQRILENAAAAAA